MWCIDNIAWNTVKAISFSICNNCLIIPNIFSGKKFCEILDLINFCNFLDDWPTFSRYVSLFFRCILVTFLDTRDPTRGISRSKCTDRFITLFPPCIHTHVALARCEFYDRPLLYPSSPTQTPATSSSHRVNGSRSGGHSVVSPHPR